MGLRSLAEELSSSTDGGCSGCGSLDEILAVIAEETGFDQSELLESMKCDSECRKKFLDSNGKFKGKKFESCEKMFSECCSGVKDPKRICAFIGRRAGKI